MRLSQKVVLEYLKSVYPDWKNFEQITEDLPVMFNFDIFELQDRIDSLCFKGKIEKEFTDCSVISGNWQRYRYNRKEEKMKTVKYEEFHKEKRRIEKLLEERTRVKDIQNKIWFTYRSMGDTPIHIILNIAGTGDIEPLVASRFADCIKEAAELAKNFKYNGFMIE